MAFLEAKWGARDSVMDFLTDPSLPGLGGVTGAFLGTGGDVLALSSAYRLLTEPPARAAYGGKQLRYRVALHRRENDAHSQRSSAWDIASTTSRFAHRFRF
jgi:hypothetical protein